MRILFVIPYAPTLIRVRPYQLIRVLASRGHMVDVATVWSSRYEKESLESLCREWDNIEIRARFLPPWRSLWNCLRALPGRTPLQAVFSFDPGVISDIQALLAERSIDVVHVEHLRGSVYGLKLRRLLAGKDGDSRSRGLRIPVVWDCVDCISYLFREASRESLSLTGRWMTRLELNRTRVFEGWLATQFDHILASSAVDREALTELASGVSGSGRSKSECGTIGVLPNGVDLEYFRPPAETREPATVVFAGKMSYHANLTAAVHLLREIMPRVWQRRPATRVVIAGKNPPRSLLALASSANRRLQDSSRLAMRDSAPVCVTGTVPDIRPYLQRATLAVAPLLYGAGIQNKVLEAMACETPVIASPRAVAALSAQDGRDLIVARDPATFAERITELLDDGARCAAIGAAGRAYVEAHHDWRKIARVLESEYLRAIESVRRGACLSQVAAQPPGHPVI